MTRSTLAIAASAVLAATCGSIAAPIDSTIESFIKTKPNFTETLPGVRTLDLDDALKRKLKLVVKREGKVRLTKLPLPDGSEVDVNLHEVNPFPEGFRLEMAGSRGSRFIDPAEGDLVFLKGSVAGKPDSMVYLGLYGDRIDGMVRLDGKTSLIASDPRDPSRPTVIFDPKDLPEGVFDVKNMHCDTLEAEIERVLPALPDPAGGPQGGIAGQTCKVVKLALDIDFDMTTGPLQNNGWVVLGYVGSLIVISDEIYRRDAGVGIELSWGRAWYDADDPWDQGTTLSQLNQFQNYWNANEVATPRDVAVFITSRNIGGGRASGIGTLCDVSDSYNVCGSMDFLFPYPVEDNNIDNWDLVVFTHELGHNLGAIHTHAYNPPLDDCFSGGCTDAPNGTLMSYCHVCDGDIANFALRFHPQSATDIANTCAAAACLDDVAASLTANDDDLETYANTAKRIDVLANDDASCGQAAISSFNAFSVQGGAVELLWDAGPYGREILRYHPPLGFTGDDSFTYQAHEGNGIVSAATVFVTVVDQPAITNEYLVYDEFDRSVRRIDAETFESLGYFLPAYNDLVERPRSIAVLPDGDVLIGDDAKDQVLRFDGFTGELQGVFFEDDNLWACEAIVVYDENVYMLDLFGGWIFKTDLNGNGGELLFNTVGTAKDMTVNSAGVLYITGQLGGGDVLAIDRMTGMIVHSIVAVADVENPGGVSFADGWLQIASANSPTVIRTSPIGNGNTVAWTITPGAGALMGAGGGFEFAEGPNYGQFDGRLALVTSSGCFEVNETSNQVVTMDLAPTNTYDAPKAIAYRQMPVFVPGDFNHDGRVDGADLGILLANFGGPGQGDINGDGEVDGADMGLLLAAWTG